MAKGRVVGDMDLAHAGDLGGFGGNAVDAGVVSVLAASVTEQARFGIGGGYANRRFNAPRGVPGAVFFGVEDQSAYAQAFWGRDLSRRSTLDLTVFGNWSSSGLSGLNGGDVYGGGANATYALQLGRLGTLASLGVYGFDQEGFDTQWSAQALLGARYSF